jgi:transposase InsO family protein
MKSIAPSEPRQHRELELARAANLKKQGQCQASQMQISMKELQLDQQDFKRCHARLAARAQEDLQLKVLITAARRQSRETYGTRRDKHELAAQGHDVGRDRVGRLPRVLELRCKQRRKLVAMTNSRHDLPVSENLLEQRFTPTRPDEVWLADITYIPTAEGWLYLAGLNDVFTCEIVGNAMGERMTQDLTAQALWRAVANKRPAGPDPPFGPRQSILRPRVPRSGGAAWHAIVIDDIEQTKAHSSSAPTAPHWR